MSAASQRQGFPKLREHFTTQEYLARLSRVRQQMHSQGLNLLIISDPANMAWLSGYDGYSFYNHQCVIVHEDQEPIWYGRGLDMKGAMATTYLPDSRIFGYPEEYVQRDLHPMEHLAKFVLAELKWDRLTVGVESDSFYFSAATFSTLQSFLPACQWKDATGLINWARAVKSAQEIEYMRIGGTILERMYERVVEVIEPGVRKNDLVAEIYSAAIKGVNGFGGDYPSIVPIVPTGIEASTPHLTWNDDVFTQGHGTCFEIAGVYRRYHCPVSRTVYLGEPPTKFVDAEKAVVEGIEAGLSAAKPGNTCEDIALQFFSVMKRHGITKGGRVGYPVGLSYPPDWGERTMSLREGDRTVLQPGMTFHFMPGLWFDDWGIEITETILITDTGVECLSNVPRKLFVK